MYDVADVDRFAPLPVDLNYERAVVVYGYGFADKHVAFALHPHFLTESGAAGTVGVSDPSWVTETDGERRKHCSQHVVAVDGVARRLVGANG